MKDAEVLYDRKDWLFTALSPLTTLQQQRKRKKRKEKGNKAICCFERLPFFFFS